MSRPPELTQLPYLDASPVGRTWADLEAAAESPTTHSRAKPVQLDDELYPLQHIEQPPSTSKRRPSSTISEDSIILKQRCSCGRLVRSCAIDPDGPLPPCEDRLKHVLITVRLQRIYTVYCFTCFLLSAIACATSLGRAAHHKVLHGGSIATHELHPWETAFEGVLGIVVCSETIIMIWLSGKDEFLRSFWGIFDAIVVFLTLLTWGLLTLRNNPYFGESMLKLDLPLILLRFVLQFCRILVAASMTKRVMEMQKHTHDIAFDVLEETELDLVVPPTPMQGRILTPLLQAEISDRLPTWCRFRDWRLTYSTLEHGTSMQTFYRTQQSARDGANLILVRDAVGCIFGGFVTERWRPCSDGYHGTGECFVFTMPAGEEPRFFHVTGDTELLLWGSEHFICLERALELRGDFECGSTLPCPALESPVLSAEGSEFTVGTFECWQFVDA